jgi:hypothetical protein
MAEPTPGGGRGPERASGAEVEPGPGAERSPEPGPEPGSEDRRRAFERRLTPVLVGLAIATALLVGSNGFQVAAWTGGDLAYHRGVALTMLGGNLQGEGPYRGLLTYYGGLYPLVLGWLTGLTGRPFDTVLSVVSWLGALAWPVALWLLGRRVWPGDRFAVACFVFLGTVAAPLTHRGPVWVNSVLASSQVAFPLYPRDVALTLLVVGAWTALGTAARLRVWLTGLVLGLIVLFHLQIAAIGAGLLGAWRAWEAVRGRSLRPIVELVAAGLTALVVAGPWLVPRAAAALASGRLLLADYPGTPIFRLGVDNAVAAFGVAGLLGGLGLLVLVARRPLPGRVEPFAVWFVGLGALGLLDRVLPGFDLVSERRMWLLGSIGLLVVASAVAVAIVRRLPRAWAGLFLAGVLVLPAVPATVAVGLSVREAWEPGRAGGRSWDIGAWEAIRSALTARVRARGGETVATYDAYGTWVWSFSGAQVVAAWLPGPFKLGFDPAVLTGHGQTERWPDVATAFGDGRVGVCRLAAEYGAGSILLDEAEAATAAGPLPLLGWYDATPAAAYRVEPAARTEATIDRPVGPGLRYLDLGIRDVLELAPGARWAPGWSAADVVGVALEIETAATSGPALRIVGSGAPSGALEVRTGGASTGGEIGSDEPEGGGPALRAARLVVPVGGWRPDWAIEALVPLRLVRATGFVPTAVAAGALLAAPEPAPGAVVRPVLLDAAAVCEGSGG